MITLAISAKEKLQKAPRRPDFQAEEVHHLLTQGMTLLPAGNALSMFHGEAELSMEHQEI